MTSPHHDPNVLSGGPGGGLPGGESSPFDVLHGHLDLVLGEWRSLARAEPWASIAPERLMNAIPEMLPRLLRLAESGAQGVDQDLSDFIAREHGYFRRGDSIPLTALAEEWTLLKRACWNVLLRLGVDEDRATAATQRIDLLFDDAVGFSLRGYYWPELDVLRGRGLERRMGNGERRQGPGNRRGGDSNEM